MKNSIGKNIILTLFGESHGPAIGAVLDGFPPGVKIDEMYINEQLSKRRPSGQIETSRIESDHYQIISGVFNGVTTGAPICVLIANENIKSADYEKHYGKARPSHTDYVAYMKYHGFEDYRGGGHFSGRLTTPIVFFGSICQQLLTSKNIYLGTHILKCGSVNDQSFNDVENEVKLINQKHIPVIKNIEKQIEAEIIKASQSQDSIGGIIQTAICNLPVGIGDPWFDSVEGTIANAVFSVGGIKGIEFGAGFKFSDMNGSVANDELRYDEKEQVISLTNNNGGINGGITNGMPVVFNMVVKPTPSIGQTQQTIDFIKKENTTLTLVGRHDPAIIRRICIVVTSIVAIVICDLLVQKYGQDYFIE